MTIAPRTHREAVALRSELNKERRAATIRAAMDGIRQAAPLVRAVSIVETEKGFCAVFDNDDRMYFDIMEM
jgi:hypothetical protein